MEIKIQCDCGQKYKFDVEPVNGGMPFPVHCPVCRAEGTAKANAFLQQMMSPQGAAAVAAAPAPSIAPMPAPSALRLQRSQPQAAPPPPAQEAVGVTEEADDDGDSEDAGGGVRKVKLGWKVWLWVLIAIVIGLISFGQKWYDRISFVKDVVQFVKGFASGGSDSSDSASDMAGAADASTLPDDDGTMVLVKHTNEMVVAQACAEFWVERYKQKLLVNVQTNVDFLDNTDALYLIQPAHKGCVQLDGPLLWDEKQAAILTGMSEYLSRKLQTMSVCALMGDDAETGTFVIYQNGERKFVCNRSFRFKDGDLQDIVKIEGEAWATAQGFKPEESYKSFTMYDANDLTEHLGLKLGDRPEPKSCVLLQTAATKP